MLRRVVGLVAIPSAVAVVACNDVASHESTVSQSARMAFRDDSIPPSLGTPTVSSAFPIDAATPTADQVGFRSAELDGTYLVGWQDQRNDGGDLYATRVSAAGTLLDSNPIAITNSADVDLEPTVVRLGDGYLLSFTRGSAGNRFVRTSVQGTPLNEGDLPFPPDAISGSGVVRYQMVAGGENGGLVASEYETLAGKYIISTRVMATDGTVSTTEIIQDTSFVGSNNVTLLRNLKAHGSHFLLSTELNNPSYRFRTVLDLDGGGVSAGTAWGWSDDYASSFDFAGGPLGVGVAYRSDGYFSLPNPSVLAWNGGSCGLSCQLVDTEKEQLASVGDHFLLTFLDSARSGKPLMGVLVALDGSRSAPFDIELGVTDWQVTCSEYVGCLLTFTKDDGGYSRVFARVLDFGLPPVPGNGSGGAGGSTGGAGGGTTGGAGGGTTGGTGGGTTGGAGGGPGGSGGVGGSAAGTGGAHGGAGASPSVGGSAGAPGGSGAGAAADGGSAGNSGAGAGTAGSGGAVGGSGGSGASEDGGCSTSPKSTGAGWPWLLLALVFWRRRRAL